MQISLTLFGVVFQKAIPTPQFKTTKVKKAFICRLDFEAIRENLRKGEKSANSLLETS